MYYPDLQGYNYGLRLKPFEEVRTIGWLARGEAYHRGNVETSILGHLKDLTVWACTNQARGYHDCDLCTDASERLTCTTSWGQIILLGSAEIWIRGSQNIWYAAPDLVVHYIEQHQYCPPEAFLASVEYHIAHPPEFTGDDLLDALIRKYYTDHSD